MAGYSIVFLIGNLTRDPELTYTSSGVALAKFGVAINSKWTDKNTGEVREDVCFVEITVWKKVAENAAAYLKKGDPVSVQGKLRTEQWTDRATGAKRSRLAVACEHIQFLGAKRQTQEAPEDASQPA